jgi:hypothetical protein
MKNLFLVPTDKRSRLWYNNLSDTQELLLSIVEVETSNSQHIYITSDEEIKEGEKGWLLENNSITKNVCEFDCSNGLGGIYSTDKKIILTTDQDLIANGVQAIDDEFLEWFVKNPNCEEVEVDESKYFDGSHGEYIIIISQEEPKQELEKELFELEQELDIPSHLRWHNSKPKQETVEEIAANLADPNLCKTDNWIAGANWMAERMYSEEEVMDMFHNFSMHLPLHYEFLVKEQFKKK